MAAAPLTSLKLLSFLMAVPQSDDLWSPPPASPELDIHLIAFSQMNEMVATYFETLDQMTVQVTYL